jgi:hypothetical protein
MSAIALTGLKRYGAVAVATLPGAVAALLPLQHSNSAAATAAMHPQHPFISAPWPAQQWRAFVSSRPAADLRDFLDGIDPDNVTHGGCYCRCAGFSSAPPNQHDGQFYFLSAVASQ